MRIMMYIVICVSMLATYLSTPQIGVLPEVFKLLPDLLSVITVLYVIVVGTQQQFRYVAPKYWLICGALAVIIFSGPLVNDEGVGPTINGMRIYLRSIPFFFLAQTYAFTETDIRKFLKLLLLLSIVQFPLAIYQKYAYFSQGHVTGDYVFGTLTSSGVLSLFLITALCLASSLMMRGQVTKLQYAVLFLLFVLPCSINETKVTIFLLPLGLLVTFLVAAPAGRRLVVGLYGLLAVISAGLIFVPLYDYFNTRERGAGSWTVMDMFTKPQILDSYMGKRGKIGSQVETGRGDALEEAIRVATSDPLKLTFGLGIGNVSKSTLGERFSGAYWQTYWAYSASSSITQFLFEIGLLGTLLVLLLHGMVLQDILYLAKHDEGLLANLAPGFVGAWVVITGGLTYLTIHTFESLAFMFWFFTGLVAMRRYALGRKHRLKANAIDNSQYAPDKRLPAS